MEPADDCNLSGELPWLFALFPSGRSHKSEFQGSGMTHLTKSCSCLKAILT
jgi:hypothetical protein